jgi:ATP synthase protein I
MSDDKPALEPIAEDARIDALEERLSAAQEREDERTQPQIEGVDASSRTGNRVLADLLGGLIGGTVIGWTIDWFAGTSPWGLLIGLFLGIVVAFRNIFRIASQPVDSSGNEHTD